jgi:hypothetical protein
VAFSSTNQRESHLLERNLLVFWSALSGWAERGDGGRVCEQCYDLINTESILSSFKWLSFKVTDEAQAVFWRWLDAAAVKLSEEMELRMKFHEEEKLLAAAAEAAAKHASKLAKQGSHGNKGSFMSRMFTRTSTTRDAGSSAEDSGRLSGLSSPTVGGSRSTFAGKSSMKDARGEMTEALAGGTTPRVDTAPTGSPQI